MSADALTAHGASGYEAAASGVPLQADLYVSADRWAWVALPRVVDATGTSAVREAGTLVLGGGR